MGKNLSKKCVNYKKIKKVIAAVLKHQVRKVEQIVLKDPFQVATQTQKTIINEATAINNKRKS